MKDHGRRIVRYAADDRPLGRVNRERMRNPLPYDDPDMPPPMTAEEWEAQRAYDAEFGERDRVQAEKDKAAHEARLHLQAAAAQLKPARSA